MRDKTAYMREYQRRRMQNETAEERAERLRYGRMMYHIKMAQLSDEEREQVKQKRREYAKRRYARMIATETAEEKSQRLAKQREYQRGRKRTRNR